LGGCPLADRQCDVLAEPSEEKLKKGKQEMGSWKKARSRVDVAMDWQPKS